VALLATSNLSHALKTAHFCHSASVTLNGTTAWRRSPPRPNQFHSLGLGRRQVTRASPFRQPEPRRMLVLPVIFAPAAEALITALVTVAVKKLIDDERESRP